MAPRLQRALSMQPSIDLPVLDFDVAANGGQHRYELAEVEWTSDDSGDAVQRKLHKTSVSPDLVNEYVHVHIQSVSPDVPGGFIKAAAPQDIVEVQLAVQQTPPQLRRLELIKLSSTGNVDAVLLSDMLQYCDLEGLTRLRFSEGMLCLWEDDLINRLTTLRSLNLSSCGLFALPSDIGRLTTLRELKLSDNRLIQLPKELGCLVHLRRLVADNNMLTAIPGKLAPLHCIALQCQHDMLQACAATHQSQALTPDYPTSTHPTTQDQSSNQLIICSVLQWS